MAQTVTLSPPAETEGVSSRTAIRLRFDQELHADDMDPPRLTYDPPINGDVAMDGDSLVFTPATGLAPDTRYTARLEMEVGLTSRTGRRLRDPVMWQFQTGHRSVVYSVVDDQHHEQLMLAPVNVGQGAITLNTPQVPSSSFLKGLSEPIS